MDGRATSEEDVLRHLRLIRSKMDPTKPCVVAELEIPADNDFLRGRWQYGSDRLEVALRNIFGVEAHGLRILACVLPGDRIVLLGCPMLFHEGRTRTRRLPASCPTTSATALSMWTSIWALTCGLHRFACCRA